MTEVWCACRTYCETDIDPAHRKLSQLQAAVRYLTGKEPDMECKSKLKEQRSSICTLFHCLFLFAFHAHFPFSSLWTGDEVLLQQTLFDAVVTAPMEAYWTALMLNTSGSVLAQSTSVHASCLPWVVFNRSLSPPVAAWQTEWKQHSWGPVQAWWGCRDTRALRKELSSEWEHYVYSFLYSEYWWIQIDKSLCWQQIG